MIKDTGIVMDNDDESTKENATEETTVGTDTVEKASAAEVPESDCSDLHVADDVDIKPASVSSVDKDEVDTPAALDEAAAQDEVSAKGAPTYSQEYVDKLNNSYDSKIQDLKKRLNDVEAESKEWKEKRRETCNRHRRREEIIKSIYSKLGDATPEKLYAVVTELADLKQQVDEAKDLKKERDDAKSQLETVSKWYQEEKEKLRVSGTSYQELKTSHEKLVSTYEASETAKNEYLQQLKSWETVGDRMVNAFVPCCLKEQEWFSEFLSELQDGVLADSPSDSAMLVFASLAELAVMERSSEGLCFEWKKQLADVGLVVTNYLHHKKMAEDKVLKILQNFAQAILEIPILKEQKIGIRIPSLGGDFNTDEVRHKTNGSVVNKVINWCVVEGGHVYCKAIVE